MCTIRTDGRGLSEQTMTASTYSRRSILRGAGGLLVGVSAGGCLGSRERRDERPAQARAETAPENSDEQTETGTGTDPRERQAQAYGMSLSGVRLETVAGSEARTIHCARERSEWEYERIEYSAGVREVLADDVPGTGDVVLLAAENDRGVVVAPVATEEFNHLLPD